MKCISTENDLELKCQPVGDSLTSLQINVTWKDIDGVSSYNLSWVGYFGHNSSLLPNQQGSIVTDTNGYVIDGALLYTDYNISLSYEKDGVLVVDQCPIVSFDIGEK